MIHVTCVCHGFHRVCETIRAEFPLTNALISVIKNIFLKAPSRVQLFKAMYPQLSLPPEPIITRWGNLVEGSWLPHRSSTGNCWHCSRTRWWTLWSSSVSQKNYWRSQFNYWAYINQSILCVSCQYNNKVLLTNSLALVKEATLKLAAAPDRKIKDKLSMVLQKNIGLKAMSAIATSNTEQRLKSSQLKNMSPSDLACFKYAPITSTQVERSFSLFKNVLSDRRRSFVVDNLFMHLIIACNAIQ